MNHPRRSIRTCYRPAVDRLEGRALMAFAGSVDPTFGNGGFAVAKLNPTASTGLTGISAIATEPDGSIVEFGIAGTTPLSATPVTTYGLVRLTADGTLDTSFGNGGEVDLTLPAGQFVLTYPEGGSSLVIQPDGKIDITGFTQVESRFIDTPTYSIVAQFDANGTPDSSFGTNGLVEFGTPSSPDPFRAEYSTVQANGQLILGGTTPVAGTTTGADEAVVTRLDANGQVDTTFGTGGTAALANANTVFGVAIGPTGQVFAAAAMETTTGQTGTVYVPVIDRLDADGTLDTSFGETGLQSTPINYVTGFVIQSNGQVDVTGGNFSGSELPYVARLNADGSLDQTVLIPTKATAQFPDTNNFFNNSGFAIAPDGDLLLTFNSGFVGPTVIRLTPSLALDATFGTAGTAAITAPLPATTPGETENTYTGSALVITASGQIVVAGTGVYNQINAPNPITGAPSYLTPIASYGVVARLDPTGTSARPGDFTGDGIADPAVYLTATGTFVIGNSSGGAGQVVQLGTPGTGNSIPATGNYYGTGEQDLAVYLVQQGVLAIKDPTGQTPGLELPIGIPGAGQTIPAPGDYYGAGSDQVAIYLAQAATWDILAPGLNPGLIFHFGQPGIGNTIPVAGDYYGTGQDDVAVYLPQTATWSILSPGLGSVLNVQFGIPGAGKTIPVPGDYDGSGKTELAVYLPSLGEIQYIPAGTTSVVTIPFGIPGAGLTLPETGDYDGSGKTEAAAYLPGPNAFVYRPSSGGGDISFTVGFTDQGPIVPVTQVVPLSLLPPASGLSNAIEAPGVMGEADDLDFLMPLASDAKKGKPGEPSAN